MPIDHVKLPVSDLDASRAFYSAALAPLGWKLVWDEAPTLGFGRGDGGEDDEPLAFQLSDTPISPTPPRADGGERRAGRRVPCRGRRGGRTRQRAARRAPYGGYYYAAFVLDPDGHNIEAVFHGDVSRRG